MVMKTYWHEVSEEFMIGFLFKRKLQKNTSGISYDPRTFYYFPGTEEPCAYTEHKIGGLRSHFVRSKFEEFLGRKGREAL